MQASSPSYRFVICNGKIPIKRWSVGDFTICANIGTVSLSTINKRAIGRHKRAEKKKIIVRVIADRRQNDDLTAFNDGGKHDYDWM